MPFCVSENQGFYSRTGNYPCTDGAAWVMATKAEHDYYSQKVTYNTSKGTPNCATKVSHYFSKTAEAYPNCQHYVFYPVAGFNQFYQQATAPDPTPPELGTGTNTSTGTSANPTALTLIKSDATDITTLLFALIMLLMFAHGFRAGNAWQ